MLLFSFVVEKVKMIDQCVSFLQTVLGHSFYSLWGCPVRPERKYIFGMCFPFSCLISVQLFVRCSTPFLPAKRLIRLTGKPSSDMSDASSPQDLSKIFSLPSSESIVQSSYSDSLSRKFSPRLTSNLEVTLMTETEFLHLQRR